MLDGGTGTCQHETSRRFPYYGSVNAHDERNSHGSDGGDILEIGKHFNAYQPLDILHFGLHILHLGPCNETSFAAQDAIAVVLFNLDKHKAPQQ
jgi:hypothetical protein